MEHCACGPRLGSSSALLLLCLLLLQQPRGLPAETLTEPALQDDDVTLLLQTFHHVQERKPSRLPLHHDSKRQPRTQTQASTHSGCAAAFASLDFLVLGDTLRLLGYLPPRPKDCGLQAESVHDHRPPHSRVRLALGQMSVHLKRRTGIDYESPHPALALPVAYFTLFIIILGRMLMNFLSADPQDARRARRQPGKVRRPEAEAWQRGVFSWLSVDWVNEWVARWGSSANSASTKISAEDLGAFGDAEDECAESYSRFAAIWEQEVQCVGLGKASLAMVLARFVGCRRFLMVMLWSGLHEVAMYIGPPLAMAWAIQYVESLYISRRKGVEIDPKELQPATIITICLFTGLPIFMGLSKTISSMMSARIAVRVCGALSSLVFKKAQRLPLSSSGTDYCGQELWIQDLQEQRIKREVKKSSNEHNTKSDVDGQDYKKPFKFNLVQLVANDINTNVVQIPLMFARAVIMIPIVAVLFGMLFARVSHTIWMCVLACLAITGIIMSYARSQLGYMMAFYLHAGKRLQYLEDALFNIRTLKACGWEAVVERQISKFRGAELSALNSFYWKLGWMYCWFYQFPRVMIFISLWGYIWLFGRSVPSDIFATLPLLLTFQSAVMSLMYTLPLLIAGRPSLQRVEHFLKQAEAPSGWPRSVHVPKWISVWPRILGTTNVPTPQLCVQGSFSWSPYERPVLHNIDISFPKGSTVGILGSVGSGKTALLHAILGELYPSGDSRMSVPPRAAYSAQVPFICEGSLKDNIIFGEAYNAERYHACIVASGLMQDLKVLPGGEEAPVGARGIALSESQRARVSLARAAYCSDADLVLLDDPYGRQDHRTTNYLLQNYIHGSCLRGRTKVVVCRPDAEQLEGFDFILVMVDGGVAVQGSPNEVMQTDEYQRLLAGSPRPAPDCNHNKERVQAVLSQQNAIAEARSQSAGDSYSFPAEVQAVQGFQLRDEESEGRAGWDTVCYFCSMGGWLNISANCLGFLAMNLCSLLGGIVLQRWSSRILDAQAGVVRKVPQALIYMDSYMVWWAFCILCWWVCWFFGIRFTLRLSQVGNAEIVGRLLYAPMDRFFDKTPVGRIMNRMSTDLLNIDVYSYNQVTMLIGHVWTNFVPVLYLHFLMPAYFSVASVPFYFLLCVIIRRFWNTLVPMRYLSHVSKSNTDMTLTEVDMSNAYVRASQKSCHRFQLFQALMTNQMTADITTSTFLKRWLVNRLFLMFGFFVTCVMIVCIWVPNTLSAGAIGLCLTNMLQMLVDIEGFIDAGMQAQFQMISLNRLHDYTKLPQEAPAVRAGDGPFQSRILCLQRRALGALGSRQTANGVVVVRKAKSAQDEVVLLKRRPGGAHALVAPCEGGLMKLDPFCQELAKLSSEHCIVGVNGAHRNAEKMAKELVTSTSELVKLHLETGWLADGARICIEDLHAGYGDLAGSALNDVNLVVEPCSKVAIVGAPGSGKSTLLLSLLRMLEPRAGCVLINNVDLQGLGLRTLRNAAGFIPQDPVLMQASVRENMDPLGFFDDHLLWEGLRMMQLEKVIQGLPGGLDFRLQGESSRLSFGQRQLLCLARVVIRQPALLLLDDATSGLDPKAQDLVHKTIQTSFPNSTVLMSAKKLETLLDFDTAVVLDRGRVAEKGPIKDLMNVKDSFLSKFLGNSEQ
mmetsp:Transcript_10600/g.19563  ORF Transcript_10600/g.19563 Transcript_10600/m.19563 type:complete len:1646 (-) Transcript_10600:56-4993(-)